MHKFSFTVFTPTYNRAHTIERVYNSLSNQTFKDFEWLIIDDGSTDNTEALIASFEKQSFPIRYIKKNNEHKFAAMIIGIKMADGKFFIPLDSDDECVPTALEQMYEAYNQIPDDKKDTFTGICGLCKNQFGDIIGDSYPTSPFISNDVENVFRHKIKGEKWGFHKTQILRDLSLSPALGSSGYILEGLIWYQISIAGYKTKYLNKAWRIYYIDEQNESITGKQLNYVKDATGRRSMYLFIYNNLLKYYLYNTVEFTKMGISYVANSYILGMGFKHQIKDIKSKIGKLIYLLLYPIGWLYFKHKNARR